MSRIGWFKDKLPTRWRALSAYRRGMAKARRQDPAGAINDYTSVIEMSHAPKDVVAMALFNRGLAYVASGEFLKGDDDLTVVLQMDGAPTNVKRMAKKKLAKRKSRKKPDSPE